MIDDTALAALAGCGSFDGYQETAHRLLLARRTAERAVELSEHADPNGPHPAYRAAVEGYVRTAEDALRVPR